MKDKETDLIHYHYTGPRRHARMSRADRAAQFSPFAALKGFEQAIARSGRTCVPAGTLDEQQIAAIERRLKELLAKSPVPVRMRLFTADGTRAGDAVEEFDDTLTGYDPLSRELLFTGQGRVSPERLYAIDARD